MAFQDTICVASKTKTFLYSTLKNGETIKKIMNEWINVWPRGHKFKNYLNNPFYSPHSMFEDHNLRIMRVWFFKFLSNSLKICIVFCRQLNCSHTSSIANFLTQYNTGISNVCHKECLLKYHSNKTTGTSTRNLRSSIPGTWHEGCVSIFRLAKCSFYCFRCNKPVWLSWRCCTDKKSETASIRTVSLRTEQDMEEPIPNTHTPWRNQNLRDNAPPKPWAFNTKVETPKHFNNYLQHHVPRNRESVSIRGKPTKKSYKQFTY